MLFNSFEFAVFLPVVLAVYFGVFPASWERARKWVLLVASYVFYGSWNPPFVFLLAFSTGFDFTLARYLDRARSPSLRRAIVALSVAGNLGILGYFKYGEFLLEQWALLFGSVPYTSTFGWNVALPVGISFYTFQTLSYTIDVYRGEQRATRSLLDFAVYVSFFPQLVAGPIVRSREFLPQLAARRSFVGSDFEQGMVRIAAGLLKKMVLADTLGQLVDGIYLAPARYCGSTVLLATYAYAFQIYFDFSGYSDIAIGVGRLFGFRIPENFDRPYLSTNPREFWRRWHISLSTWLRDYLYVSLGGNRRSRLRTNVNLMITMLLGGLWHGAAWNFVIWGALHGLWLVAHRVVERRRPAAPASNGSLIVAGKKIAVFHVVCIAWVFFRSPTFDQALGVFSALANPGLDLTPFVGMCAGLVAVLAVLHLVPVPVELRRAYLRLPPIAQGVGYALACAALYVLGPATQRFIYFQF